MQRKFEIDDEWTFDVGPDGEENEHCLLGMAKIFGTYFHVTAVRVTTDREDCQVAVYDPSGRLDDIYEVDPYGGPYRSVQIPGFDGDWVLCLTPHKD